MIICFRPLSRGLSFNVIRMTYQIGVIGVFVPFLGDFFSMSRLMKSFLRKLGTCFRPLPWGLFFKRPSSSRLTKDSPHVFVPFLGDFFSKIRRNAFNYGYGWFSSPFLGTFFQDMDTVVNMVGLFGFSSPFLGTFFQDTWKSHLKLKYMTFSSPFLGTFFQMKM